MYETCMTLCVSIATFTLSSYAAVVLSFRDLNSSMLHLSQAGSNSITSLGTPLIVLSRNMSPKLLTLISMCCYCWQQWLLRSIQRARPVCQVKRPLPDCCEVKRVKYQLQYHVQ